MDAMMITSLLTAGIGSFLGAYGAYYAIKHQAKHKEDLEFISAVNSSCAFLAELLLMLVRNKKLLLRPLQEELNLLAELHHNQHKYIPGQFSHMFEKFPDVETDFLFSFSDIAKYADKNTSALRLAYQIKSTYQLLINFLSLRNQLIQDAINDDTGTKAEEHLGYQFPSQGGNTLFLDASRNVIRYTDETILLIIRTQKALNEFAETAVPRKLRKLIRARFLFAQNIKELLPEDNYLPPKHPENLLRLG